jgi:imidazole glycerol-phosphate synthase subunit HisF
MSAVRIIPRLEVKGPNLVKGIQFEGLRVLGKPQVFAEYYYQAGADELLYTDVVASLYERNSLLDIIEATARNVSIPLTVEGGIRSVENIRTVLKVGADKVALNTAAIKRPSLISDAAECFGSSTIVISIQAKQQPGGTYEAYVDNGRQRTGLDVVRWATQAAELGAGEILLTSIDREGTGKGFDVNLVKLVADRVQIPVIACGGAGKAEHVTSVVVQGHADAVAVSSIFHYYTVAHLRATDPPLVSSNHVLGRIAPPSNITPVPILDVKHNMLDADLECRV